MYVRSGMPKQGGQVLSCQENCEFYSLCEFPSFPCSKSLAMIIL